MIKETTEMWELGLLSDPSLGQHERQEAGIVFGRI